MSLSSGTPGVLVQQVEFQRKFVLQVITKIPSAVYVYHSNYHMYVVVFYPHGGVVN
jgi:hypothetical protein